MPKPLRKLLLAGAASLALAPAAPQIASADMSDSDRDEFREEVRDYLLANPEIIVEALQVYQNRQAQAEAQADVDLVAAHADQLFDDGYSWVGGNPDGDVTVVEFMDYRCGYCRKAFEEVEELVNRDGNIRFVLKEFPILGQDSVSASRLAIATRQLEGDEAYKAMHDALMSYSGGFDEVSVTRLVEGLGYEAAPIIARMDSDDVTQVIARTHDLAQKLQISGTPTFVMGDQMLRGYVPLDGMQQIVSEARS